MNANPVPNRASLPNSVPDMNPLATGGHKDRTTGASPAMAGNGKSGLPPQPCSSFASLPEETKHFSEQNHPESDTSQCSYQFIGHFFDRLQAVSQTFALAQDSHRDHQARLLSENLMRNQNLVRIPTPILDWMLAIPTLEGVTMPAPMTTPIPPDSTRR